MPKNMMELQFEKEIAQAEERLRKLKESYALYKEAVSKGEMVRTVPAPPSPWEEPPRQMVAMAIKRAIQSFPAGEELTARKIFDAIPQSDILGYARTRPSIVAWLRTFERRGEVKKTERGVYTNIEK